MEIDVSSQNLSHPSIPRTSLEFADVSNLRGTIGKTAQSELNEIRNLAVGKPAPEITGEDTDGKPFKLSDYKGKVVVVDDKHTPSRQSPLTGNQMVA
jgi:AhpC/TSA family